MNKFEIKQVDLAEVELLKSAYLESLTAPLDGMWESFANMANHFGFFDGNECLGYAAINQEGKLLQFFTSSTIHSRNAFEQLLAEKEIIAAVVPTSDSNTLSLCHDVQRGVQVNALMYYEPNEDSIEPVDWPTGCEFQVLHSNQLDAAVGFCETTLGADRNWLTQYLTERIQGEELFGLWKEKRLIATGEYRPSRSQKSFADLGMIVGNDFRGQGLATSILMTLRNRCRDSGRSAICSTEFGNRPARRAIEKAGFVSRHRILDFQFSEPD